MVELKRKETRQEREEREEKEREGGREKENKGKERRGKRKLPAGFRLASEGREKPPSPAPPPPPPSRIPIAVAKRWVNPFISIYLSVFLTQLYYFVLSFSI